VLEVKATKTLKERSLSTTKQFREPYTLRRPVSTTVTVRDRRMYSRALPVISRPSDSHEHTEEAGPRAERAAGHDVRAALVDGKDIRTGFPRRRSTRRGHRSGVRVPPSGRTRVRGTRPRVRSTPADNHLSRRRFLIAAGGAGVILLAGCQIRGATPRVDRRPQQILKHTAPLRPNFRL